MRILSITAGAANMYCGSCLRDNALAAELMRRGHDVTLLPVYTPTRTDESNVSADRVLFGGISVYLQQHAWIFRHTPRVLDRLWDAAPVIRAFAGRSMKTDPRMLGELTVSMLEGEHGHQRKEFEKLVDFLRDEPVPDVVNVPNSLLIAMAGPIRRALDRPVVVTMQGEDLFLDGLEEPFRSRALDLIRRQVPDVDMFLAVSEYYVDRMRELLGIPPERIAVTPLGINTDGFDGPRPPRGDALRVGYFARVAPEKGLHELAEAFRVLRQELRVPARLEAAGYLGAEHQPYLDAVVHSLRDWGLEQEFTYHGTLEREGKIAFLRGIDVLCVPAPYPDPKGMYLLEAMATGTPVVQPRRGAFVETVERTGGGLLTDATPHAIADGLRRIAETPELADELGARGARGVREHYSVRAEADCVLAVFDQVVAAWRGSGVRQA